MPRYVAFTEGPMSSVMPVEIFSYLLSLVPVPERAGNWFLLGTLSVYFASMMSTRFSKDCNVVCALLGEETAVPGWEEDPLKLLHAIAGYESCCRCTIDVHTREFKAKKETELAVSDEIRARIKSFLESHWTTFEKLCSSAEIAKAGMEVAQLAAKHRRPSESLLRASRRPESQKTPNSCSRQWEEH